MTIELNRKQTWALGTEATLDTEEENEAIQVDMDSIPTVIKLGDNDAEEAPEEKGATGGIPASELNIATKTRTGNPQKARRIHPQMIPLEMNLRIVWMKLERRGSRETRTLVNG